VTGPLPNFFIVGAMKSGTSSMAKYLADHDDVFVVPEKELRFFDRHWDRGLDWYRQCFAAAGDQRAIGEATPTYMDHEQAAERIASTIPDARLIAMLRNPVDRAHSHYWHWRIRLGETREFEDAVARELAAGRARKPMTWWDPEHPEGFDYLAPGCYLPQLERLCRYFPREQLLVILFEDLTERPVETFQEVCRFLGIDDTVVPDSVGSVENPFKYYYPGWLWAFFVRVRIGRFLPGRVGAALYRAMVRVGEPNPPMDPALREKLADHFAPDNEALGAWLGRDLSAWR